MTTDPVTFVLRHLRNLAGTRTSGDLSDSELLERFCRGREETAFALLVQRHGPMVLSVCRRIVHDAHDAEDAFQATFLVLARSAQGVRKGPSLGSFLYGVAQRVAMQARIQAARRRAREKEWVEMSRSEPCDEMTWQELRRVLDEELSQLPDKYRAPIVLCYLEGKTHEQAARELGCPRTSFSSRLGRARNLLHQRLTRRGVAISVGALAAALTEQAAGGPLPARLTLATVRGAVQGTVASGVEANVDALAQWGVQTMQTTRLKTGFALLLAGCLLAVGYGLATTRVEAPPAADPKKAAETPTAGARQVSGVVVEADGKPVARADVWLTTSSLGVGDVETFDHGETDDQGRFQVTVPARWFEAVHSLRQEIGLIAHKSGRRVAVLGFSRSSVPPATGARLVLAPAATASVRVLGPDGQPVAGAQVQVKALACDQIQTDISDEYAQDLGRQFKSKVQATPLGFVVSRQYAPAPEELSRRLTAQTDARGTVIMPDVSRADLAILAVNAGKLGAQKVGLYLYSGVANKEDTFTELPDTVRLLPVGRVSGRLTARDVGAVKGLKVRIDSHEEPQQPQRGDLFRMGFAEATADAEGRFDVAALAQGQLSFHVDVPQGATVRAQPPADRTLKLNTGRLFEVSIPVYPAVRVRGTLRERGGKAIAGARVLFGYGGGNHMEAVQTDAEGRYSFLVPPGEFYTMPQPPLDFLPIKREDRGVLSGQAPEGKTEYDLPPLELTRAATLRGVVSEDDRPAGGATVHAIWWGYNTQFGSDQWLNEKSLTTNERGEFTITGLAPRVEVRLKARRQEALTAKVTVVQASPAAQINLRIARGAGLALAGRVRDAGGRPVAGARIEVLGRPWLPKPNVGTARTIAFEGGAIVRTDANGRFQTPRELEPDGEYRVVVNAEGFQTEQSSWFEVGDARPLDFGEVVLQRRGTIQGRIVDRQGKPIPGAHVLHVDGRMRIRADADADGRYRIEGSIDGPGFLFVQKAGYRIHGQPTPVKPGAADMVLTRRGERVETGMKSVPLNQTKKERFALASRVLEPGLKQVLARGNDDTRLRPLEALARIDHGRVLEQIDKKAVTDDFMQDYLRRAVAQALLEDSPDEARTVVDAMRDPSFRSMGYNDLCDALPAAKRKEKIELLAQALLHARGVQNAAHRVVAVAMVVKRLREVGEIERADKLLRENEATARELPTVEWPGYARAAFAEELAVIDLPAALALIKDLQDPLEYDRHHGNIAHKLAGTRPAEAERVLGMLGKPGRVIQGGGRPALVSLAPNQYAVRVCYRMAMADLERARRIADRISDPHLKAQALGVMAQALAGTKPAQATELLDQGFAVLTDHVASGKDHFNSFTNAAVIAGALVPVAELIDPQLVPEFFWQAVALRTPPPQDGVEHQLGVAADFALALMLARYDRATARDLMTPAVGAIAELAKTGFARALFPALAAVEPKWAVEVFESLPAGPDKERERPAIAKLLTLSDEARWRNAYREAGMWFVDDEDL
jgi:RNA polymerase sigma factor (sigma-70 family)